MYLLCEQVLYTQKCKFVVSIITWMITCIHRRNDSDRKYLRLFTHGINFYMWWC